MFQARHYHRHPRFHGRATAAYTALQVAALYGLNIPATGKGQKIGIIELGGAFSQADLDAYSKLHGIPSSVAQVKAVAGAQIVSDPGGANVEVNLDAQIAHALARDATKIMYFAANTEAGFADAIDEARADGCCAISISWGAPEDDWSTAGKVAMESALKAAHDAGIGIYAAAGDNGSGDGESGQHVDYPGSSQYVTCCGGTTIAGTAPLSEHVWNDGTQGGATGGGVSAVFAAPAYQKSAGTVNPKLRCTPDIAGNADPETGYPIVSDGQESVVGGTSCVAPLYAGFHALLCELGGKRIGPLNELVYAAKGVTRDITQGNNGVYTARVGTDCCTGLGVLRGAQVAQLVQAPPAPQPVPTPAPVPPPAVVSRTLVVSGTNLAVTVDGHAV